MLKETIFLRAVAKDMGSMRGQRKPETIIFSRASRLDHGLVRALTPTQGEFLGHLTSRILELIDNEPA